MAAAASTASGRSDLRSMGASYQGFAGDTLASALLANGVHLVGARSSITGRAAFSRRDRRSRTRSSRSSAATVARRRTCARPRSSSTTGSSRSSQNRWPSLAFDVGAVNDLLAPLLPAGFYYKTFMGPRRWDQPRLDADLRAADPPRGRSRPGAAAAGSRPLRQPLRALRRAGRRRRPGGARRGAGGVGELARASSCATSRRSSAARCSPNGRPTIDGVSAATGWPSAVAHACGVDRV